MSVAFRGMKYELLRMMKSLIDPWCEVGHFQQQRHVYFKHSSSHRSVNSPNVCGVILQRGRLSARGMLRKVLILGGFFIESFHEKSHGNLAGNGILNEYKSTSKNKAFQMRLAPRVDVTAAEMSRLLTQVPFV